MSFPKNMIFEHFRYNFQKKKSIFAYSFVIDGKRIGILDESA